MSILADPRRRDRLIIHMTRATGADAALAAALVKEFERGLQLKKL
jgi:hypothetical protein